MRQSTIIESSLKPVESILISQPEPTHSPYFKLEDKYGVKIDFRSFIQVDPVEEKEFRKNRIRPDDYNAVVFSSKNSIDHFFRICEEMRAEMSSDTRYFCLTKAVADYLQKFIVYRKRKVFYGKRKIQDLEKSLKKFKDSKFILPCSNLGSKPIQKYLDENEYDYQEAMMYRTVSSDLSDLSNITYDILVFFSPLGITSLYENFPDFKQNETRIAVFGNSTTQAVIDRGLDINIQVPTKELRSMAMALEKYIQEANNV